MSRLLDRLFKVKVSSKGQVFIPKHIGEALKLNEGDELLIVPTKEGILMKQPPNGPGMLRGLLKGLDVDIDGCEVILNEAKRSLVRTIEY
jgi:AbrB family looped-hinge helix DNA binding protein